MSTPKVICWFRQDLRLADNPALFEAAKAGEVLPIYILDNVNSKDNNRGDASNVWLHHSLNSLNTSLDSNLSFYFGDPLNIINKLCSEYSIENIYWNRCYEPWSIDRDTKIKKQLQSDGIKVSSYNGSLLWEPQKVLKSDGSPYKVFTPFYRRGCLEHDDPRRTLSKPESLKLFSDIKYSVDLDQLDLLPKLPWGNKMISHWKVGEKFAHDDLSCFLNNGIKDYKEGRNFPAKKCVSKLSPRLHFGELSPNQVWYSVRKLKNDKNVDHFCSELGWREFSYNLLYFNPDLPKKNLQSKFDNFPWENNNKKLSAWRKGKTGIPIVDAGMRQLWQTGYMHNRVRMVVGSFLVKNLLIDWREGEKWFWNCLIDADLANNSASWQWIAGCGADAAPYFRIFNPVTQGQKFDEDGKYVKEYVPELKNLPDKYLFKPWEAPSEILRKANITLGKDYPMPIVDLKLSREKALEAFSSLKKQD